MYVPRRVMKAVRTVAKRRQVPYSELLRNAIREYIIREAKIEKENDD